MRCLKDSREYHRTRAMHVILYAVKNTQNLSPRHLETSLVSTQLAPSTRGGRGETAKCSNALKTLPGTSEMNKFWRKGFEKFYIVRSSWQLHLNVSGGTQDANTVGWLNGGCLMHTHTGHCYNRSTQAVSRLFTGFWSHGNYSQTRLFLWPWVRLCCRWIMHALKLSLSRKLLAWKVFFTVT